MADEINENEIKSWVEKAIEKEDIQKYTIEIKSSNKIYGFIGHVVFVDVKGFGSTGETKNLYLVVKFGKTSPELRTKLSLADYYARELYFYSTVIPRFEKFQNSKKMQNFFNNVPKCYAAFISDEREVIVLENLRIHGYEIHNKFTAMNAEHIEIILDRMARFHAISFCYRDQCKDEFDSIFENYDSMNASELNALEEIILQLKDKIYTTLKPIDLKLAEEFKQKFKDDMWNVFKTVLGTEVKEKVVTHCDGWNNNYLFKYKENNKTSPTNVVILDWQMSNLHTPVLDLTEILFSLTAESLSNYKTHLEFYHNKLSKYITELGSNPDELFPFPTLMDHWKKYFYYGWMKTIAFLDLTLCNENDATSYTNMDPENYIQHIKSSETKSPNDLYFLRLACIVRHYCNEF